MTSSIRDLLREGMYDVHIPTLDAQDVIVRGERRLRRRRRAAVLGAVGAVVVIAVGGVLSGRTQPQSEGPVAPSKTDQPDRLGDPKPRRIVWSDDLTELSPGNDTPETRVGTLHVGDSEVKIDQVLHSVRFWSMFVTDAGAVYAQDDGAAWFTDGGDPVKIAAKACAIAAGDPDSLGLATGNSGSLAAWFDCAPGSRGDLVVYDTSTRREVARHRVQSCDATISPTSSPSSRSACMPDAIVGEHVYFHFQDDTKLIKHQFRYDVTSGEVEPADQKLYLDDLRSQPRTLLVGDTWETGTPTEGTAFDELYFRPVGERLEVVDARRPTNDDGTVTHAFDIATGQPVQLRLPSGYQPRPTDVPVLYTLFEWLDDDTVALAEGGFSVVGDILVCHISDGSCSRVAGPPSGEGIVPGLPLPG